MFSDWPPCKWLGRTRKHGKVHDLHNGRPMIGSNCHGVWRRLQQWIWGLPATVGYAVPTVFPMKVSIRGKMTDSKEWPSLKAWAAHFCTSDLKSSVYVLRDPKHELLVLLDSTQDCMMDSPASWLAELVMWPSVTSSDGCCWQSVEQQHSVM